MKGGSNKRSELLTVVYCTKIISIFNPYAHCGLSADALDPLFPGQMDERTYHDQKEWCQCNTCPHTSRFVL